MKTYLKKLFPENKWLLKQSVFYPTMLKQKKFLLLLINSFKVFVSNKLYLIAISREWHTIHLKYFIFKFWSFSLIRTIIVKHFPFVMSILFFVLYWSYTSITWSFGRIFPWTSATLPSTTFFTNIPQRDSANVTKLFNTQYWLTYSSFLSN